MTDIVVTLPKSFGLKRWIEEGDAAGEKDSGRPYFWKVPTVPTKLEEGDRVYVVYDGHLIGYSILVGIRWNQLGTPFLMRRGAAVAVTIDEEIPGFRGYRYRFWPREAERPFPEWRELANR